MTKYLKFIVLCLIAQIVSIGVAMADDGPEVITMNAQNVKATRATLWGTIDAKGKKGRYMFMYGKSKNYSSTTDVKDFDALNYSISVNEEITGLQPNTTYHFCLVANHKGGALVYGEDKTFTTDAEGSKPSVTTYDAEDVTDTSATLCGVVNPNGLSTGYWFEYGTTTSYGTATELFDAGSGTSSVHVEAEVTDLKPGTKYYFRLRAMNSKDVTNGSAKSFTTEEVVEAPDFNVLDPTNITETSVRLRAKINPHGVKVAYCFQYGTTRDYGEVSDIHSIPRGEYNAVEQHCDVYNLEPGTTYHYRLFITSEKNDPVYSGDYTFSTDGQVSYNSPFTDCPSPDQCGSTNYGDQIFWAAMYLYEKGILKGEGDGTLRPDQNITRAELAKLALYSLYGGESGVPSTLVTDNFPSIYSDLQDKSAYYYRPAKALLYLEYRDGVSPFDRNRSAFNPGKSIERNLVLKVLCETFNIAPLTSGNNPFTDFNQSENCWGYAAKCSQLGITTASQFKPYSYCTRGDAILFLYRALTGGKVTIPNPKNTEDYASSDFFVPANFKPSNINMLHGLESGNFNFYQKDFFQIPGYVSLNFGVTYNSCLTELPTDFYPVAPMGSAWSHSYNTYMHVIESTDNSDVIYVVHKSDGSMLMYDSNLKSLSEGNYVTLQKSSSSKYLLTTPEKTVYTFERNSTSDGIFYLAKITDIRGNDKTINYESGVNHRRVSSVETFGRKLTFSYLTDTDLLKSVTDPSGRVVNFSYSNGELASLTDAKGQKTTFNYGSSEAERGLLKTITLPRGNTITNSYQQRKLTSTKTNNDTPTTVSIANNYANGITTSDVTSPTTGGSTITTTMKMNAGGNLTSAYDGNTTDISVTYGDSQNPTLPTKVKNNITGISTSITYNSHGMPTQTTLSGGGLSSSISLTYNSDNQVKSSTDANGNTTTYSYSNGALASVTDALGNTTNYTNNSYGSPTRITDASGKSISITYDSYGNVTKSSVSALGISNSFVYDAVSRMTSSTDGRGNSSSYSYDKNDNLLSATDAMSNTINYAYDANDNLTSITNANGGVTSLTYDDDDLLTEQSFQGHTKSYTYYDNGALKTRTLADGSTLRMHYDSEDRITDNGYATMDYNREGRLASVGKDGKDIEYRYDGLGRISEVEYDGKTVEYDYDSNGNVIAITYPGGKTVSYSYDALNRVTAVTDWNGNKASYKYNVDGSLSYMQLPNKVRTAYSYDAGGRLIGYQTRRDSGSGSTIVGYDYTLDENGNHTEVNITDVFVETPSLSSEDITYSYNRDNRITEAGDVSFGYDGNGNTTSRTGRTMKYDKANNLTSVLGDFDASYTYDGLGQRRSATRDGVTTKYILSGNNVIAETNSSGTIQYYYIYGPTGLISRIDSNGNTRYYINDCRGSIVAMTDASASASLTHRYQYDEFGKVIRCEEEDLNRFRFVGNRGVMYEAENLTFMRARYYDESIGRFLSEDPIWSTNLYPYCNNNPLMRVDPAGEKDEYFLGKFGDDVDWSRLLEEEYAPDGISSDFDILDYAPLGDNEDPDEWLDRIMVYKTKSTPTSSNPKDVQLNSRLYGLDSEYSKMMITVVGDLGGLMADDIGYISEFIRIYGWRKGMNEASKYIRLKNPGIVVIEAGKSIQKWYNNYNPKLYGIPSSEFYNYQKTIYI